jgi:hypothetical protein
LSNTKSNKKKNILESLDDLRVGWSLWFIAVAIVLYFVLILPLIFGYDYSILGLLGDTIGGILNPLIGIAAALLTFFAFYIQFRANEQVREQFRIQQFENHFYEMLKLHRENLLEMNIANLTIGRKCFIQMFPEFKYIYLSAERLLETHGKGLGININNRELLELAYDVFFFGIGPNSEPNYVHRLNNYHKESLFALLNEQLERIQMTYEGDKEFRITAVNFENADRRPFEFRMFYFPFDGHSSRLGHYYRHLFQLVNFVLDSEIVADRKDKYKYLKTIRAQLSNQEQLLLYYNAFSPFGKEWFDLNLFDDYKIIKNIPIQLADFGVIPHEQLGIKNQFGEYIFEWDEVNKS